MGRHNVQHEFSVQPKKNTFGKEKENEENSKILQHSTEEIVKDTL